MPALCFPKRQTARTSRPERLPVQVMNRALAAHFDEIRTTRTGVLLHHVAVAVITGFTDHERRIAMPAMAMMLMRFGRSFTDHRESRCDKGCRSNRSGQDLLEGHFRSPFHAGRFIAPAYSRSKAASSRSM